MVERQKQTPCPYKYLYNQLVAWHPHPLLPATANLTAKRARICKTPQGRRRDPAVIGENGRLRPDRTQPEILPCRPA
jgi:hypothetical protein